jgi:hypothetical protein
MIQGVRNYDTGMGQWTTPDVYKGNVHDPMSQQPYMWNRNNPYMYADPSGFETVLVFNSEQNTLRVIGITGTRDAGIDRTFEAANNVARPKSDPMTVGGFGHMPDGVWNLGSMQGNSESETPAYGNVGFIPLTDAVVGQSGRGLGIHSGRNGPKDATDGCIRTSDAAMKFLKEHPAVLLEVNWPGFGPAIYPARNLNLPASGAKG